MKNKHLFFLCIFIIHFFTSTLAAQSSGQAFTGHWKGSLKTTPNRSIEMILHITQKEAKLRVKLSTQTGITNMVMEEVQQIDHQLSFQLEAYAASYQGTLQKGQKTIKGTWTQAGQSLPLQFEKMSSQNTFFQRTQTPLPPYPYQVKEVRYTNTQDKVTLAGTLTSPQNNAKVPAIILLTVAGPNDRDQSFAGHHPYQVIADYFTRKGFAVLRSDDRGVGKSQGNLFQSTMEDFTEDTQAAIKFLKTQPNVDRQKIFLMGNSEGGAVAALTAARDPQIAGIILLGAPGVSPEQIILKQGENLAKTLKYSNKQIQQIQNRGKELFQIILTEKNNEKARHKIKRLLKKYKDTPTLPTYFAKNQAEAIEMYLSPWYRYQLAYKPAKILRQVKCPVLALAGSLDRVIAPRENLKAIHEALTTAHNHQVVTRQIPGLNHIFQTAKTGSPLEYGKLAESFSPRALKIISNWLNQQIK